MSAIDDISKARAPLYDGVWTWERHGDGWALYVNRGLPLDPTETGPFVAVQHGLNILTIGSDGFDSRGEQLRTFVVTAADKVPALAAERDAERKAWLRYVDAAIEDRAAQFAEEQEQEGAESWHLRTTKALDAAKQALVDLGVDFEMLESEEP